MENWFSAADGPEIAILSPDPELLWPRMPAEDAEAAVAEALETEAAWPVSAGCVVAGSKCSLIVGELASEVRQSLYSSDRQRLPQAVEGAAMNLAGAAFIDAQLGADLPKRHFAGVAEANHQAIA